MQPLRETPQEGLDTIEIEGLSALLTEHPTTGIAALWGTGNPPPEEFRLILRYKGVEYRADFASTPEGCRRIGVVGGDHAGEWWTRIQLDQPERNGVMIERIVGQDIAHVVRGAAVANWTVLTPPLTDHRTPVTAAELYALSRTAPRRLAEYYTGTAQVLETYLKPDQRIAGIRLL